MTPLETSGTMGLLTDLIDQVRRLVKLEYDLLRSELAQNSARAAASLAKLAAGIVLLMAGLLVLLAAGCAFLVRLGFPVDLACFSVAVVTLLVGWLALWSSMRSLKPESLIPRRSLEQITSLMARESI